MKVLVPLNSAEHVDDYIQAGAGEFYMGFYDPEWTERFGEYADINRLTGFREAANPYDFETVLQMVQKMKEKERTLYITFNASIYSKEELKFLEKYFMRLKDAGSDGVIVSCMELVNLAKAVGIPSVISTIAGIYNSDMAKFYADHGTKRIILPRDLMLTEIESITKNVGNMEYEVFMMRNGCAFSDSNCLGMHRIEMCSICSSITKADNEILVKDDSFGNRHAAELNNMIYSAHFHNTACGLCSIYRFIQMGIVAGKIVGRSDQWENICRDIRYITENVEIARACGSEEEYLKRMVFPEDRNVVCKLGLSCYYPEVRFV
ncbi:MAG: U32 family peptidase [Lachnospiraceae bacterium]|nr:U32 family peptidase [Lachnospiraceae bacterium]